ncbi:MAG: hypothetical protein ACREE0_06950 [Phenylobacterium sp.]
MPFAYPHRAHLKQDILARVKAGERVVDICAEPGMPSAATLQVWRRADAGFAAELAQARSVGDWRRRLMFNEAKAKAFLARVAAGERIRDLLSKPGMPSQKTYQYWRRTEASFAEELWRLKGLRDQARGERLRGRYRAFDQATADQILVRVARGGLLKRVLAADPALPCRAVVYRWRKEEPEWDGALKVAFQVGRRERGHPRALRTPQMTEAILDRIVMGGSLRSIGREPGMPKTRTLESWIARDAAFSAEVARACDHREDWFIDQMTLIADEAGPISQAELRRRWSPLARQHARLQNRPGRKWRGNFD